MKNTRPFHISHQYLFILLPAILILVLIGLLNSPWYVEQPDLLTPAVTVDFLVTIPAIYFLLILNRKIPNLSVIPIFFACFWLANLLIPEQHRIDLLWIQKYIIPVAELTLLTIVVIKVSVAVKQIRKTSQNSPDIFNLLSSATESIVPPKAARLVATELAIFYYAFTIGSRTKENLAGFTYHRKGNSRILLVFLGMLIILETIVFHFLLQIWSPVFAWILTGLSIYTFFQIMGFISSYAKRPVLLKDEKIMLRHGITVESEFHVDQIKEIHKIPTYKHPKDSVGFSILGKLDAFNILLEFKTPIELKWIYGFRKPVRKLSIFIDDPELFIQSIEKLKARNN